MKNENGKVHHRLHGFTRTAVCFSFLIALALGFAACGQKAASEQVSKSMSKEEIKAKIMEKDIQPSAEAVARKEKSIALLKQKGVPTIQHLPAIEDSQSAKKRTKDEIAHRAIALCLVAVKGEGLDQPTVTKLVDQYSAQNYFTPAEKEFIENATPTQEERVQFSWRYEGYWVMLWALGYIDTLEYPDKACDVPRAVAFLHDSSTKDFSARAKLRDLSEILDQADLIYRYDWAAVNARLKQKEAPAHLDAGVVMERHHALNWLIGYMDQEWDDVTTDT
jgi:hypothetical protein